MTDAAKGSGVVFTPWEELTEEERAGLDDLLLMRAYGKVRVASATGEGVEYVGATPSAEDEKVPVEGMATTRTEADVLDVNGPTGLEAAGALGEIASKGEPLPAVTDEFEQATTMTIRNDAHVGLDPDQTLRKILFASEENRSLGDGEKSLLARLSEMMRIDSCVAKLASLPLGHGEPFFTLRGQDIFTASLVQKWIELARLADVPADKLHSAQALQMAIAAWPQKKIPGREIGFIPSPAALAAITESVHPQDVAEAVGAEAGPAAAGPVVDGVPAGVLEWAQRAVRRGSLEEKLAARFILGQQLAEQG
jgi:hypothetical protein